MGMNSIVLSIYFGGKLVGSKTFRGDRIFIGSDRRAQIRISHPSIALLHAVIEKKKDQYFVADLESEKGILKNGKQVRESLLVSGDQIQVGRYFLKVEIDDGRPKVAPQAALESTITDFQHAPGTPVAATRLNPLRSARTPRRPPPAPPGRTGVNRILISESVSSIAPRSHGPIVQVLVTWGDRVLQMHHYRVGQFARLGPKATDDLVVPYSRRTQGFLQMHPSGCQLHPPDGATLEITNARGTMGFDQARAMGKALRKPSGYVLNIAQGDTVSFSFAENFKVSVRYVPAPPKPITKIWRPFTLEQLTSALGVCLLVATFGIWNSRQTTGNPFESQNLTPATAQIVFQAVPQTVHEDPSLEIEAVDVPESIAEPAPKKISKAPTRTQTLLNRRASRSKQTVFMAASSPVSIPSAMFSKIRDLASAGGAGTQSVGTNERMGSAIDRDGVRLAIEQILDRIRSCYERALIKRVNLEGEITVRFLIGPGGIVQTAETHQTTLNHVGVERCVEGEIKQQQFPLPVTGTVAEIDYPFIFKRDQFKNTSADRISQPRP